MVADEELLGRGRFGDLDLAHLRLRRLRLGVFGRNHRRRELPVRVADLAQNGELRHVADDDEDRVVGGVVGPVKAGAVVGREPEDVGHPADRRPVVGMLAERGLVEELAGGPLDVVVDAVASLVGDDLFLARDLLFAQDEASHPFALELHREREAIGRERLVIVGPVDPGRGVRLGAVLLEEPVELAGLDALALVEHQVLEEVGEPGLPWALVA